MIENFTVQCYDISVYFRMQSNANGVIKHEDNRNY